MEIQIQDQNKSTDRFWEILDDIHLKKLDFLRLKLKDATEVNIPLDNWNELKASRFASQYMSLSGCKEDSPTVGMIEGLKIKVSSEFSLITVQ